MEERPSRKPTRLQNFDYSITGAYFVTICTQDRQKILSEIVKPNITAINCSTDFKSVGDGALDVPQNKDESKNATDTNLAMDFKPVGDGALDVPQIRLTKIGEIVEKYLLSSEQIPGVEIDEYAIMPDHIHAIIFIKNPLNGTSRAPSPTATNEALPHIVSTFKRFCNKEIGVNIFQRSFYDHVIRDRKDYETRKKYINENPIKWYYDKIYEDE